MGKVATLPLPSRGSPQLQRGGQNQKWPTYGQSGYVTPAVSGIPSASERGAKSEGAHKWAKWLCQPCRLGDPHRFRAGAKIRTCPLVGKVAMSPLPSRGSPPLQNKQEKSEVAHLWGKWLCHPCGLRNPHRFRVGGEIRSGPLGAKWLCHPCRLRDPRRFGAGGKIRRGQFVGKVATSPLPSRRSPPLQSGGQNQNLPTRGQSGYITPAVSGFPTASERGRKIRSGPPVGKVAVSPLPSQGSRTLQSSRENQKGPTCQQGGWVTPATSGIPTASERGGKSELGPLRQSG